MADRETLVERLRGIYRVPITDGLGPVGAGEEPDNPNEFVRNFETPPIQQEAASELSRLNAKVEELERDRNEWEAKAISLFWACPDATKVGDVQKLKAKADSLLAAEAQVADLSARLARAVEVMRWYAERVAGCRKFTDEGHMARNALDADGGERARAFLSEQENPHG